MNLENFLRSPKSAKDIILTFFAMTNANEVRRFSRDQKLVDSLNSTPLGAILILPPPKIAISGVFVILYVSLELLGTTLKASIRNRSNKKKKNKTESNCFIYFMIYFSVSRRQLLKREKYNQGVSCHDNFGSGEII